MVLIWDLLLAQYLETFFFFIVQKISLTNILYNLEKFFMEGIWMIFCLT